MTDSKKRDAPVRMDKITKDKFLELKRKLESTQGSEVSMRELTRRLGVARNFEILELELIRDAELKRRLKIK